MADIELVIKIPEKWFNDMVKEEFEDVDELCAVIQHGTQLPKGHGRLIDADALEPDSCGEWNGLYVTEDTYKQSTIDNAPTFIEADNESENRE